MAELPSNVAAARDEAYRLQGEAGTLSSQLPTIGDELRKRVNTLFGENQDVLGQFNTATTNLVTAPGKSYETTQSVEDPFARERLAAIDLETAMQPALAYGGLLGQRMGSIGDIVQSGTNAFKAKVEAAVNAAQLAQQKYQDLFNEFQVMEQLRQKEASGAGGKDSQDIEGLAQGLLNGQISIEDIPSNVLGAVITRFNQLKAGQPAPKQSAKKENKGGGIIQDFIGGTKGEGSQWNVPAQLGALGSMVVQGYGGLLSNPKGTLSNIWNNVSKGKFW